MGPTVWIAVESGKIWEHFVKNARIGGGRRLGIKIDGSSPFIQNSSLID